MKRMLLGWLALSVAVATAPADGTKPGKPTIEPTQLSVSRKLDPKKFGFSPDSTSVGLVVNFPGKQLIGVDPTSKVSELKDDKGNSLVTKGFGGQPTFNFNRVSNDRSAMSVGVFGGAAPGKGASRVHLKGNLVVRCGTEEKTTGEAEVELKVNTTAKLGDFSLRVNQEKTFGGGASFSITAPSPVVKSITAKAADGSAIEVNSGFHFGFGKSWTYNYTLRKEAPKAKITITYFSKDEAVTVPVDLTIGIGL